jgi:hypothetical protein
MNVEELLNGELVLFVSDEAVDECVKSVLLILPFLKDVLTNVTPVLTVTLIKCVLDVNVEIVKVNYLLVNIKYAYIYK